MKDIPIQATEEAIKLMKDKNQKQTSSPNIHIEPSESPKFTVWMNCADYVMLDYLWMANEIKHKDAYYKTKYPYLFSPPRIAIVWNEREFNKQRAKLRKKQKDTNIQSTYIDDLIDIFSRCKEQSVFSAAMEVKPKEPNKDCQSIESQRKNQISLFWMIKEIQPIAPIVTIIALCKGIPPTIQEELDSVYAQLVENQKQNTGFDSKNQESMIGKDLYPIILELLNTWKRSFMNSNGKRKSNALQSQRDYWRMIFFLKLQYELCKEIIHNRGDHIDWKFDLNFNFQLFLSFWPYSPQLFININPAENALPAQWDSELRLFFKRLDLPDLEKNPIDGIYLPEDTANGSNFLTLSEYCSLGVHGEWAGNWLTPFSPYFAAYYYTEDAWLHNKFASKKGESYKKGLVLLLLKGSKIQHRDFYESDELPVEESFHGKKCCELLGNGEIIDDYRYLIAKSFDKILQIAETEEEIQIGRKIDKELSDNYYSLLLGVFSENVNQLRTWNTVSKWISTVIGHETQDTSAN